MIKQNFTHICTPKDHGFSHGQLKLLLSEDMIVPLRKKGFFSGQEKLLFLKDMIVPLGTMNFP
jgi:hypothetical protein